MGFEPTTFGTTIRHSNRLSYIHHLDSNHRIGCKDNTLFGKVQIFAKKKWLLFAYFVKSAPICIAKTAPRYSRVTSNTMAAMIATTAAMMR